MQEQQANPKQKSPEDVISRQLRRQMERKLKKIQIIPDETNLTATTGLGLFIEIFHQSPFARELEACLPERTSHRSVGSYLMALLIIAGHIRGLESLSSLRRVRHDPYLCELFEDEVAAVRTIGDFLYDFEPHHIEKLNIFLNKMAKGIFEHLNIVLPEAKRDPRMVIDMDSSHHVHYGEEIEGLWYNYKNQWCLESHVAFDQLGLCHGIELRPGNTKPGKDAHLFMERVFRDHRQSRLRRLEGNDYFRGDSAYCNQEVIKKCLDLGLLFTITAHKATTQWDKKMDKTGLDWQPWIYGEDDLNKAKKAGLDLPKSEVAKFYWEPSWAEGKLLFPIVVKRTWVQFSKIKDKTKKFGQRNLFELDTVKEDGDWEYYAVVTNMNLLEHSFQEVFEHHRKRGNAENFVREGKYNFHLKNFPCEKLLANQAWVCFAQIAHNLIRWVAILDNPESPSFAKKIRDDFIFHPGRVIHHARQVFVRTTVKMKEVLDKIEGWQFPDFNAARVMSVPSG
jgi:hypothetical protein